MFRKSTFLLVLSAFLSAGLASASDSACPNCPPENPHGDVFDPSSCVGPTLSSAEAADKFCRGSNHVELGPVHYALRGRNCNKHTGCRAWSDLNLENHLGYQGYYEHDFHIADRLHPGVIELWTRTEGVHVGMTMDNLFSTAKESWLSVRSLLPNRASESAEARIFFKAPNMSGSAEWVATNGNGVNNRSDRADLNTDRLQFTDHCARFILKGKSAIDGSASWVEYEFGGIARY